MKSPWLILFAIVVVIAVGLILYILQPNAFLRTQVTLPARQAPLTPDDCQMELQACGNTCQASDISTCIYQCDQAYLACLKQFD